MYSYRYGTFPCRRGLWPLRPSPCRSKGYSSFRGRTSYAPAPPLLWLPHGAPVSVNDASASEEGNCAALQFPETASDTDPSQTSEKSLADIHRIDIVSEFRDCVLFFSRPDFVPSGMASLLPETTWMNLNVGMLRVHMNSRFAIRSELPRILTIHSVWSRLSAEQNKAG